MSQNNTGKSNANARRSKERKDHYAAKNKAYMAIRELKLAAARPVKFDNFSVVERIQTLRDGGTLQDDPIKEEIYWDGTQSMIAVDQDNIPIAFFMPGFHSAKSLAYIQEVAMAYHTLHASKIIPKSRSGNGRNQLANFVNGRAIGVLERGVIVEQGHPHITPRASSANVGGTVTKVEHGVEIDRAFQVHRAVNNHVLSFLDPAWHDTLTRLRVRLAEDSGTAGLIHGVDSSVFPSHTLTWNRFIPDHRDTKDHMRGWSVFNVAGDFTSGGDVFLRSLGLRARFLPGGCMFVMGCLVTHAITEPFGGNRFGYTSYTPASIIQLYLSIFDVNPAFLPFIDITAVLGLATAAIPQTVIERVIIDTNSRTKELERANGKKERVDEQRERAAKVLVPRHRNKRKNQRGVSS